MKRLRFGNEVIKKVTNLIQHHMIGYDSRWSDAAVRRLIRRVGAEQIKDLVKGIQDQLLVVATDLKDISDSSVEEVSKAQKSAENLVAIDATGAERLVTPCPLCTAQIESNLFRAGSSVEVDDLTVFIAQRLPKE